MRFRKCEMVKCRSGKGGCISAYDNIGDGRFSVRICPECAFILGVCAGEDLPEPAKANAVLEKHYRKKGSI
jgi:hypothetical protein